MHSSFALFTNWRFFVPSLFALLSTCPAVAQDDEFKIGTKLPDFPILIAVNGTEWDSKKLAAAEVLILAFTCNRCPYSVDYEDRLNALQQKHSESGGRVQLLVINSNYGPDESLPRMKTRAKEKQFEFPYVKDKDQSIARSVGAVYTPEFFVFDRDRRLAYKGALDDATNFDNVTKHYVNDAVVALLAGKDVKTAETGARGCTIRFERRRPRRPRRPRL